MNRAKASDGSFSAWPEGTGKLIGSGPLSRSDVSVQSSFQLPTSCAPIMMPSSMSVSRDKPLQMTVLPGGGRGRALGRDNLQAERVCWLCSGPVRGAAGGEPLFGTSSSKKILIKFRERLCQAQRRDAFGGAFDPEDSQAQSDASRHHYDKAYQYLLVPDGKLTSCSTFTGPLYSQTRSAGGAHHPRHRHLEELRGNRPQVRLVE